MKSAKKLTTDKPMILQRIQVPAPGKLSSATVFTLFNTLNFVIAVALAAVQAWSNMIFFAVICFNAITGIMTEMRAKRMIDKLNLMSRELVTVIRRRGKRCDSTRKARSG